MKLANNITSIAFLSVIMFKIQIVYWGLSIKHHMFTFVFPELLSIFSGFITLSTSINYSTPVWLIRPFIAPREGIETTVLRDALVKNPDYFYPIYQNIYAMIIIDWWEMWELYALVNLQLLTNRLHIKHETYWHKKDI